MHWEVETIANSFMFACGAYFLTAMVVALAWFGLEKLKQKLKEKKDEK